tara:strand:+ start:40 stop:1878 length:1839 start_codon:yes stop_codon:yes gene_type:complete
MPIRVEHGPNLAPVGQLAYRTGQLEYRNKRRTELERLAMQQAEMRQRAQQQQNQIAASLQGQKMSHMNAMQRLAVGQQFGQINAEQANQWKVQADVKAQENRMIWGKQLGQNQLDLANLNAGLADQKTIQNIQNAQRWKDAQINLNPAGEAEYLSISKQITAMRIDPKIPPQELEGSIAQLEQKRAALRDQEEFTSGIENKLGNKSIHTAYDDGSAKSHRVVVGHGNSGEPIVEYPIATTRIITDEGGNQTEEKLTPQEIYDATWTPVEQDGQTYRAEWDKKDGQYKVAPGTQPTVTPYMKELEDYKESYSDWTKEMSAYTKAKAGLHSSFKTQQANAELGTTLTFDEYAAEAMGPPPVAPVKPVDPDVILPSNRPLPLDPIPNDIGVGQPDVGVGPEEPLGQAPPAIGGPVQQPPQAPVAAPAAGGIGGPVAPEQAQAPVSKEFEAVPAEYHPQKQWGDTPIKSTPEGYKALGEVSIYAIAPEDQQTVYQARQREAKVLPWDSAKQGNLSPGSLANALKRGQLEYGAKVDLSKDNSAFAAAWKEATGQDVLVINDNLMWKLLSPGLTLEQQRELQQHMYTQKKKHFEYYGEPGDFPSDNMIRFQQRVQEIQ